MRLSELSQEGIEKAIQEFYEAVNSQVAANINLVSRERYSIRREPRRMGAAEFPFHLAADLDVLFRFSLGGADASTTHIQRLCREVLESLHTAPIGRIEEDWEALLQTPLGLAIHAARARIKLREDEGALDMADIVVLSDLTPQKVTGAKLAKKKVAGQALYSAADVRAFFEKEGIRI